MNPLFIDETNPARVRAAARQLDPPPLCPFCRHWHAVRLLWTCNVGCRAGENTVECEAFEPQLDLFEETA